MDIFFQDPTEIPLPPEEVRIRRLAAEPWPDGRRVRVYFEVDPFLKRPSADLTIANAQGVEVAQASIIEPMTRKMEFVMHLRGEKPAGAYTLRAVLFYAAPLPEPAQEGEKTPIELPERSVVDEAEATFEVISP